MARDITDQVQCLGCRYHRKWHHTKNRVYSTDECEKANNRDISNLVDNKSKDMFNGINASDCTEKFISERIKNTRLWVSLYFKGRERDWIVIEEGKHRIFIQGNWFVRKVFGMADKFHAWQDKRREKKWLAAEAKRKAAVLTHIVKELPRA